MGKPNTDSSEQKKPPTSGSASNQSAKSSSTNKPNPAKLPPAGFIYSDDEDLMDELSMGWGLTASEEQDELDQIINKTVDMSTVSNTKLKALAEPPRSGVERIERVRAERASREIVQPDLQSKQTDDREAALKRAKQAAAEKEEAARAAELKEKAEREYAERQAAEREAALKARAEEEERKKAEEEARAKQEREDREQEEKDSEERAGKEARDRAAKEQEEEEAKERAALEARLLKRAEDEAKLREEKELKEEAERRAAAKAKEEKDAAEREEAEREIAERERLQKEAAAKLKARQEEARREAEEAEQREREEQERAAQKEKEIAEAEAIEAAEKERSERAEREKKDRAEKEEKERARKDAAAPANKVTRFDSGKKEIKAQRIGPKTAEEKNPAAVKADAESKTDSKVDAKPTEPVTTGTTARLSRTPEEELAALLAEDGHEPDPPEEKPKKIEQQEAKTSRSGLAAIEPTDDTPLTGMLKALKPAAEKTDAKQLQEPAEAPEESTIASVEDDGAKAVSSGESIAATDREEAPAVAENEDADGLLSSEIVESPVVEPSEAESEPAPQAPKSKEEPAADVPDFLKTETPPAKEEKKNDKLGLSGVDKFYKPERVKLGDFVKKKTEVAEDKSAEKATGESDDSEKSEKSEKLDKPERKDPKEQAETAALKILNLPDPVESKSEASGEFGRPSKDTIRESVKAESPEKKAAIIAALKKLEEQVDESDLNSLSTEGLKDVLSKLPDMSGKTTVTGAPAAPGKKEGTRTRMPSPAMARLASAEEPTADRDIAREKLKVMQKVGHTLPELKSYLPQKRALLLIVAAVILGALAAVMTVRAETISARQALQKKDYNGALSSLSIALALYPFSAEAHFLKGSALYLNGKLSEAYSEYDTALKLSPDMRDALERRAAVSYRLGNYYQSAADYEKLLQQEGEQSQRFDQLLSLANAYLSVGDLQKAADTYNRCLDRKPNYVAAMVGKIAVSNQKKLYERAVIESGKALAASPGNKEVLVMRARAYTGMRNFAAAQKDLDAALKKNPKSGSAYAARANLRLAQKKYKDAYADFDKAMKLSGKEAGIYLERAQAYVNEQKFDLASKDIAKARQLMGSQLTPELYVVNTQVQIANKQAAKALEDLKDAQQKFPNNPDIVLATADALAAVGKIGDGIITSEKAMDMDKTYVDAILKHGLLSVKFGNKMRAAADFEQVLKLDPNNVTALKTRGLMFLQQEKYASAQEDLAKVVAIDPTQTEAKAGLDKARTLFARLTRVRSTGIQREGPSDAYLASLAGKPFDTLLNDGYAAYKRGDFQTAVPTLEQAVKINPRDTRGRRYLAYAYKQADQLGEAASQFDALYPSGALGPQDTQIYIEMLLGSGQQDRASKIIEDALAKAPGNQYLYLQLANCLVAQGENQKAIQTCTRGIAISPRSAIAQQLIELRQSLMGGGSGAGSPGGGSPAGGSTPDPGA